MSDNNRKDRLYQDIAAKLFEEFSSGAYAPGDKLPTERDLTQRYKVSRPTIREALIALEVQGLIQVRVGSGAYLLAQSKEGSGSTSDYTAFEVTEARLLVESEAAALAAAEITDEELSQLEKLVDEIASENARSEGTEEADYQFHMAIARATRNSLLPKMVDELWQLRSKSAATALLYAKARMANVKPVVEEHQVILHALKSRKPSAARKAMQDHLKAVLDSLLFATEEQAIEKARQASAAKRDRYARALSES